MYLISSFPYELNDDILIFLYNFDLAVKCNRFWAASRIFDIDDEYKYQQLRKNVLMNLIPYMNLHVKEKVMEYASTCVINAFVVWADSKYYLTYKYSLL